MLILDYVVNVLLFVALKMLLICQNILFFNFVVFFKKLFKISILWLFFVRFLFIFLSLVFLFLSIPLNLIHPLNLFTAMPLTTFYLIYSTFNWSIIDQYFIVKIIYMYVYICIAFITLLSRILNVLKTWF